MKTIKTTWSLMMLLIMVSLFVNCGSNDPAGDSENDGNGSTIDSGDNNSGNDALSLPFTTISLGEGPAHWVNLEYDENGNENKLLVVNDSEELQNFIIGDYPPIDFSKKTLLLAYGGYEGHVFDSDEQKLQQVSERDYILTVNVPPSAINVIGG